MALRNFWMDAQIDGRKTELSGGPRSKDGGISLTIYQRDCGEKVKAVTVDCYEFNGELTTAVCINGKCVGMFRTRR